jgi:hypothetical protein
VAHVTVAASERAIKTIFDLLVASIRWEKADSTNFGPFTAGYHIKGHLEGGTVDLRADNTIQIKELDIKWDKLEVSLGLDIPEICVGGGCLDLPWPLPDICLPKVCVFSDDPDVEISLDLAAFVAQEISFTGSIVARYYDASVPPPLIDPCGVLRDILTNADLTEPLPSTNQWHLFIDPQTVDIDLFDFPDIVGDLIENALTNAIVAIIPGGWVRDLILAIIGGVADLIRFILDIPDEIDEWLSDLFNVSFGLFDFLVTLVLDLFGNCVPIARLDDPFTVLEEEVSTSVRLDHAPVTLVPVRVPIRNLTVGVNDVEMIVQADIGA